MIYTYFKGIHVLSNIYVSHPFYMNNGSLLNTHDLLYVCICTVLIRSHDLSHVYSSIYIVHIFSPTCQTVVSDPLLWYSGPDYLPELSARFGYGAMSLQVVLSAMSCRHCTGHRSYVTYGVVFI